MLRTFRTSLLFLFSASAIATAFLVSACTDEAAETPATDAGADGNVGKQDSGGGTGEDDDDDDDDEDAGKPETGAGEDGPGEAGAECAHNRDCQLALRCECEDGVCGCQPGARGTGKNGIDTCTSGNDCASSICVEGSDGSFCSDECKDDTDCTGSLPKCFPIVGLPKPICWFADK